jgi:hypothetical protein
MESGADTFTVTEQTGAVGLCIGCAILHHDFREILAISANEEYLSEVSLPEAWIDGKHYRLLPFIVSRVGACRECNLIAPSLYVPAA